MLSVFCTQNGYVHTALQMVGIDVDISYSFTKR